MNIYNFLNLYSNIPKGMTLANTINTKPQKNTQFSKQDTKTIGTTALIQNNDNICN